MRPKIAVVTGYAKDPEFVKTLLLALNNQTVKYFDCYIYASPNSTFFLDETYFDSLNFKCYHLQLKENKGFAGNNNDTISFALKNEEYEYVALVNDDTIPHEAWLEELVKAAQTSEDIGAVCAKMVFYQQFITLDGYIKYTSHKSDNIRGIRFYNNSRFSTSFYPKRFHKAGFYKVEEDEICQFRWTSDEFTIEMPLLTSSEDEYKLKLFVLKNSEVTSQSLELKIGETTICNLLLDDSKIYYEISIPKTLIEKNAHYIIQNAGSELTPDNNYEIGFGEIDKGQYEEQRHVSLFCGGACLITKKALLQSGLFMEGLFSYYEDSELSVRIRKNGYKIIYAPKAVIKHYHTGTSKEWSPLFTYYAFRNRIIFSAKTFGFKAFIKAFYERARETFIYFKLFVRSRFRNQDYKYRLKLNLVILKDSLSGIVKFKPKYLN